MKFQAQRAHAFFRQGRRTAAARRSPLDGRGGDHGAVYRALLRRMEADHFRVFEKEYRLNRLQKAGRVAGQLLRLSFEARSLISVTNVSMVTSTIDSARSGFSGQTTTL